MVSEASPSPSVSRFPHPAPAENGFRGTAMASLSLGPSPGPDKRPPSALADQELRFKELCETRLFLDAETQQQAWALYAKCEPAMRASTGVAGTAVEEIEALWQACTLQSIKKLSRGLNAGFTLSQLLRASNISLVDFFNEFNHYLQHAGALLEAEFGASAETRLQVKELQENFVKLTVVYGKYKKDYLDLFSLEPFGAAATPPPHGAPAVSPLSRSRPFRLGWLLLLVAKAELLPPFPDLVTYGNLLIAVLHLLLLHMPTSLTAVAFSDTARFPRRTPDGVDVLGSLCTRYQADREVVQSLVGQVASLLQRMLPPQRAAPVRPSTDAAVDWAAGGCCHLPGLLEGQLEVVMRALDKRYSEVLQQEGDVDERSFLDPSPVATLGSPAHLTPAARQRTLAERASQSPFTFPGMPSPFRAVAASPFSSPLRAGLTKPALRGPPATPFSSAMQTATWLRTVVGALPSEPPPSLLAIFRSCTPDPSAAISKRCEAVLAAIFPTSAASPAGPHVHGDALSMGSVLDAGWARVRLGEARKLYWRVLEALVAGEAQRHPGAVLAQETFHRCLLALCSELVLASHKSTLMAFPAVLKPARVTPFDLIKVIEALVRVEASLPRELKRHLNSIEEKILESLAWDRGSSLYSSLYVLRSAQASPSAQLQVAEMDRLQLLPRALPLPPDRPPAEAAPVQGESGGEAGVGPGSESLPAGGGSGQKSGVRQWTGLDGVASPQRSRGGPGAVKRAEAVLSMLSQKVLKLLAMRLRSLSERLGLARAVGEAVYRVVQHALAAETHLFFLRHCDQVLLCSIYGVCKVAKLDVTFKDIIAAYRKQPQYRPDTIRTVPLKHNAPTSGASSPPRPETGDVIKLYNQVFVPRVKAALLSVAEGLPPHAAAAPPNAAAAAAPSSPPQRVSTPAPLPASPFASLPAAAFSPKKVAAGIYVSPLKGHRAGQYASTSPHSAVLMLGRTDGFESPSRALSRLSDQINATRPLRRLGQLNFDDGAAPSGGVTNAGNGGSLRPSASQRAPGDSTREEASGWSSGTSTGSPTRAAKRQKTEAA